MERAVEAAERARPWKLPRRKRLRQERLPYSRKGEGYYSMRNVPEGLALELEAAAAHLAMTRRTAQIRLFGPLPKEETEAWLGRIQELAIQGMRLPIAAEEVIRESVDCQMPRPICDGLRMLAGRLSVQVGAVGKHALAALASREGGLVAAILAANEAHAAAGGSEE